MPHIDSPIPDDLIDDAAAQFDPSLLTAHTVLFEGGQDPEFYRGVMNGLTFLVNSIESALDEGRNLDMSVSVARTVVRYLARCRKRNAPPGSAKALAVTQG